VTLIAQRAVPGRGFDTEARVTSSWLQSRRLDGHVWCADYLPLPHFTSAQIGASCISATDFAYRISIGYQVSLIQHPRYPGWDPAECDAAEDARCAMLYARAIGFPLGAHLWVDLEGMKPSTTPQVARAYAELWATTMIEAGQLCGAYYGYQIPLTSLGMWLLHGVTSYWTDVANRKVDNRGCAIKQGKTHTVDGVEIDEDELLPDLLGDMPMVAAQAPDEVA
jgi:hypothetical protein